MKKEPDLSDLVKIFQGHEHQYMEIGTLLNVHCVDLQHSPQSDGQKLVTMFQRWKNKYEDVTWEEIVDLSENLFGSHLLGDIVKFLSSREAHDKYLDRPDFDSLTGM